MFLPPKLITILLGQLIAVTMFIGSANGQQAEFDRRMAAMQEARVRAQLPAGESARVASSDMGVGYADPPPPTRVAQAPRRIAQAPRRVAQASRRAPQKRRVVLGQSSQTRPAPVYNAVHQVRTQTRGGQPSQQIMQTGSQGYTPAHMHTAQLSGQTFMDGGSPIMSSQIVGSPVMSGQVMGSPIMSDQIIGSPVMSGQIIGSPIGTPIGTGSAGCTSCGNSGHIGGEYIDSGYSSCDSCGDTDGYFADQCCGRSGCATGDCWITGIGSFLFTGEYFGGATSFRSAFFDAPGGNAGELARDDSHGFYGGFNFGMPLCRLSCGVFSGQVGVRSVQTNFNGSAFTTDNRDQLFVTAGIFRRVDYGFQAGVVADILRDNWFTETNLVQVRGELSWVYPAGSTFGFRFANNVQDDVTSGTFNGNAFTGLVTSTSDNYRFFLRRNGARNGYGEIFAGWSENDQGVVGLDFDKAVSERLGMQAGFTYFINDDQVPAGSSFLGGNVGEAYNIFVGFSLRPRGSGYYNSYDRPLFAVADNGTMLTTRNQ